MRTEPTIRRSSRPERSSVMYDVPDGCGMVIVHADAAIVGRQIEIEGAGSQRTHAVVHRFSTNGRATFAAVFPSAQAGSYSLLTPDGARASEFELVAGTIVETALP